MTGAELKAIRVSLSRVTGDCMSLSDMAALCGLNAPARNGKDTYRKWEHGDGPSGPAAALLSLLMDGLNHNSGEVRGFCLAFIREQVGIIPF